LDIIILIATSDSSMGITGDFAYIIENHELPDDRLDGTCP